jgi:phage FluMu gp28-like protein
LENINGVDLTYLQDEAHFIQSLTRDSKNDPVELDHWQQQYIRDTSPYIAVNKSRQVGFSWIESAKALARSHLLPDYQKYFVSINLDESKNKIRYVRQMFDTLPPRFRLKLITDAKTEIAWVDKYNRVSLVKALTSREPRGMHGDICLDEFAHYRNPRKIFHAAGALTIRGGQFTVGSSPMSQKGPFYEICSAKSDTALAQTWGLYEIYWYHSRHLCNNVYEAIAKAPSMSTAQRVLRYGSKKLIDIYNSYSEEAFVQEFECQFVDEQSAFMPTELIHSCWEPDYGKDASEVGVKLLCWQEEFGSKIDQELAKNRTVFTRMLEWIRKNCKGIIEIGYDVGRHHDIAAMIVTDTFNGKTDVRAILGLDKVSFETQFFLLKEAMRIIGNVTLRIDRGGMGEHMSENLVRMFGSRVEPIVFGNTNKGTMATGLKIKFEQKTIRIPAWLKLFAHIHSIQKTVTASNNLVYEADSNDHHGDYYWALALACYRANNRETVTAKPTLGGVARIQTTPID